MGHFYACVKGRHGLDGRRGINEKKAVPAIATGTACIIE